MPNKEVLVAASGVVDSLREFFRALGPAWGCIVIVVLAGGLITLYVLRARHVTRGWREALSAKDDMIRQINEQNRELRLERMVGQGMFSKAEASQLVYGDKNPLAEIQDEPAKKGAKP